MTWKISWNAHQQTWFYMYQRFIECNSKQTPKKFYSYWITWTNVILSNIIGRSDNGIARLKTSNFNKHLNSLNIDTINNGNISSEHLSGSGLHLHRHWKLVMNLIKKLWELRRRKFNRIDNKMDSIWLGLNTML